MKTDNDGRLDIDAAEHELKASSTITNDTVRRAVLATLQTAALLDIARSLRVVAADAELGIMSAGYGPDVTEPDDAPLERPTTAAEAERAGVPIDDFLVEGDVVLLDGGLHGEPGEWAIGEVKKLSVSEGDVVAHVDFGDGEPAKVWARGLTRVIGDERPAEATLPNGEPAPTGDDGVPILSAESDDPEEDFAPASALDALREVAAEKPGKKKGSKK